MRSQSFFTLSLAAGLAMAAVGLSGCTSCYTTGNTKPTVRRPVAAPAATPVRAPVRAGAATSISVSPEMAVNPVRTQHVLVATVRDSAGNPVSGESVEWILTDGGVGAIVDVDGGEKIDNGYARSTTASSPFTLDRGNDDPSDDVQISAGQTWAVITASVEGSSNVVAYAPGIADWNFHKAFATKNWMDVTWEWPVDATNRVGAPHTFTTRVMRYSDGTPLSGYLVNYEILSGPTGTLAGGGTSVSARTDSSGVATATLNQSTPNVGVNDVEVTIIRPANSECCLPEKHIISGVVRKTWVAPSIECSKSATPAVTEGDNIEYTITVMNTSDLEVRNVTVTDNLPDGVQYVSSSPMGSASGNQIRWDLGSIEAMGSRTVSMSGTALRPGTFTNRASVSAEGGALNSSCEATTVVDRRTQAALAITCQCPSTVLICEPITWQCTVTNTGDGTANDVRVACRVPDGLVCDTSDHFIGSLAPGESRTISTTCTASRTGSFTKTCVASGSNTNSAEASCTTSVQQPALAITKRSSRAEWKAGRPISWEITVRSAGQVAARDVVLTDMVPAGTTFKSASGGGTLSGNQVVWNLGTMEVGQEKTVTMETVGNSIGIVRNTATVRAYCAADATAEAQVNVTGVPAILLELIDVDDPIEVGGTETYVIDVTNQGTIDDHNIVIRCTLPAQQDYISAEGASGVSHSVSGKVVTFAPLSNLAPKARATYRVVVRATAEGDVRFAIRLTADSLSSPVDENESTHQY